MSLHQGRVALKINCPDDFRIAAESFAGAHRAFMWTPAINKTLSA